ncbi:desulfoferrodoxin [Clostridium sporogenes]|uniref:desulfoferrodoxin n=1 Tax=Clostridium sporogenes TaxID=1509 RepID=UPI0013D54143|nr:desulfoferrodoxin [Clostridium sporogenes]MBU5301400.1 desulfoferrodoxin [Clostridium sporogenes]NFP92355.1 desulfoferrodoxin [Clostridium sporogenes]
MVKLNEVYKCEVCGNMVEVVHASGGQLVCCGKPMRLLEENTTDAALEKHVPVVEKTDNGIKVKVGEKEHPMEEKHYIEWIEVITENKVYKKHLKPGEKPEAEFKLDEEVVKVREYCNIHGLWKK